MMLGCLSVLCITSAYCFFNDTATTEIYTYLHTLSLHDALPISSDCNYDLALLRWGAGALIEGHHALGTTHPSLAKWRDIAARLTRSEEHTSELQSLMRISYAVFCLKKKNTDKRLRLLENE